jgi:outer membrane protein insertion porin family
MSFNLQYARRGSKTLTFQFTDPKVFDSEWLAGFDLYVQDNTIGYNPVLYRQFLGGANFRVGREIFENTYVNGTYKIQHSRLVDEIAPSIFSTPYDQNSIVSSVEGSGSYDTRNNRLDPSDGEYFTLSGEFAGLGGRVFQKYLASARIYRRLFWKVVWRSNLEYGLVANAVSSDPVPDSERFILGGIFSLRGYPFSSIGTTREVVPTRGNWVADPSHHENNDINQPVKPVSVPLGGQQKFVLNQELEFPLIPDADIRAALFIDAGNAWDGQLSKNAPVLYSNWGWGIRWYSPLGPLRFEWGYPFNQITNKKGKGVEFQFVIAPTF